MINIINPSGGVGLAFKLKELNQHFSWGGGGKNNMTSENQC